MSAHDEAVKAARQRYIDTAGRTDTAIAAYLAHMAAAGWKLTPREATGDMLKAQRRAVSKHNKARRKAGEFDAGQSVAEDTAMAVRWSAMHDAAPSPEEAP